MIHEEDIQAASIRAWQAWAFQALIFPWLGPLIHYLIARNGRSDADEIIGVLFMPMIYLIFGLHAIARRSDRLAILRGKSAPLEKASLTSTYIVCEPSAGSALNAYRLLATIATLCLAFFEAAMVLFISTSLFDRSGAHGGDGAALGYAAYLAMSFLANIFYVSACKTAITKSTEISPPQ